MKYLSHPISLGLNFLLFLFLLLLVAQEAMFSLSNPDTFFHIRVGEEFRSGNWKPWDLGHFNSFDNAEWYSTQWLSQLLLATAYTIGGYELLPWIGIILFTVLIVGFYWILRSYATNLVALTLTALFFYTQNGWFSLRPQLLSFFLSLIVIHIFIQAKNKNKVPWVLVPIFALWVNVHGIWLAGLVNIVVLSFAYAWDNGFKDKTKELALFSFAIILSTLLNPAGWGLWKSVLSISSSGTSGFSEWATPDFTTNTGMIMFALLSGAIFFTVWKNNPKFFEIALLLLGIMWAVWSLRSLPIAFGIFAIIIATGLTKIINHTNKKDLKEFSIITVLFIFALGYFTTLNTYTPLAVAPVSEKMTSILEELPEGTVVYTDYTLGSYALQELQNLEIFVHGYVDSFTKEELSNIHHVRQLEPGWDESLKELYDPEYAVIEKDSQVAYALELKDWVELETVNGITLYKAPE